MNNRKFESRIIENLTDIYSYILTPKEIDKLALKIKSLIYKSPVKKKSSLTQNDIILITYANTITQKNNKPFLILRKFLKNYIKNSFSTIHILPFFPSSSDGGFSIIDYFKIDQRNGSWNDIRALSKNYKIMADVVLNHGSRKSKWFNNFLNSKGEGKDFYFYLNKNHNLNHVTRARSHKLLQKVKTKEGTKYLWCTFSHDQIDFDYKNPKVLIMFLKIISFIMHQGVSIFRLDAVAFLWKRIESNCVNLDQTHAVIRLIRTFLEKSSPNCMIVTETNLPFHENLSYFGNADEAHLIYNFSLAPLIINTLIKGDSSAFRRWSMGMPPAKVDNSFINFLASHDGIGIRPLEGILSTNDIQILLNTLRKFGSKFTYRKLNNKKVAYEANITLIDALSGTIKGKDKLAVHRFLCAHALLLSYEGTPAIYIHSLLATKNDYQLLKKTKIKRSINRHVYNYEVLKNKLDDHDSMTRFIFFSLLKLINIRRKQKAFHPNATQYTLNLGNSLFAVWRQSTDKKQSIFAISSVVNKKMYLDLETINLINTETWYDLISEEYVNLKKKKILFMPYQSMWISNIKC